MNGKERKEEKLLLTKTDCKRKVENILCLVCLRDTGAGSRHTSQEVEVCVLQEKLRFSSSHVPALVESSLKYGDGPIHLP